MRKLVGLGVSALLMASALGCTSAQQERREEMTHRMRARDAASVGDYQTAAREQRESFKAERQAAKKSVDESFHGDVPPPLPVPY